MENDQYFASLSSSLEEDDIEFGGKLLHQACLWDNSELVSDLLFGDGEKNINAQDCNGRTALHAAVISNSVKCARLLLMNSANPNLIQTRYNETQACHKTCLHIAAERGSTEMVATLLEFGANAFIKDENGFTAMDLAEKEQHSNVVKILRTCISDREKARMELYEELAVCVHSGQIGNIESLLNRVRDFARNGADMDEEISLLINWAPNGSNTLLFKACQEGHPGIVSILIDSGADGRQHPVTKYSPLYIAAYHGRLAIVTLLLSHFPELVSVFTVEHWLPIHAAAMNNHLEIVSLLLNYRYPIAIQRSYLCVCDNALKLGGASGDNDSLLNDSLLGQDSADSQPPTGPSVKLSRKVSTKKSTNSVEKKCFLYLMPFDVNAQDIAGQSVLYMATLLGNQTLVELLLNFRTRALAFDKSAGIQESELHNKSIVGTDLEFAFTRKACSPNDEMLMSPESEVSSISLDDDDDDEPASSSSNDVTVISNLDKQKTASGPGSSQTSETGSRSLMQKLLDKFSPSSSPAQSDKLEGLVRPISASSLTNEVSVSGRTKSQHHEESEVIKSLKRTGTVNSAFFTVNPLNIDLYCNYGAETALHCAVRSRHLGIVSLFLERGANCNLPINNGPENVQRFGDGLGPIVTRVSHFNHNLFRPLSSSQRRFSLTPKPVLTGSCQPAGSANPEQNEHLKGQDCQFSNAKSKHDNVEILSEVVNDSKSQQKLTLRRDSSGLLVDSDESHKVFAQNTILDFSQSCLFGGRSRRKGRSRSTALREAIRNRDRPMADLLFRCGALDQIDGEDDDDDYDDEDDADDYDNSDDAVNNDSRSVTNVSTDQSFHDRTTNISKKLSDLSLNTAARDVAPETTSSGQYSFRKDCQTGNCSTLGMNALEIAFTNGDMHFITRLLAIKAYSDSEGRINKRAFERLGIGMAGTNFASGVGDACSPETGKPFNCTFGNTVTMSSLFPTTPVMVDWQKLKIRNLEQYLCKQLSLWLLDAALAYNPKLRPDSGMVSHPLPNALAAITRIDLSENALTSVPLCLFNQLPSLKSLNLSKNRLQTLPETEYSRIVDDELILKCRQNPDSPEMTIVSGDRENKKVRLFSRMKKSQSVTSSLTSSAVSPAAAAVAVHCGDKKLRDSVIGWCLPSLEELYLQDNCLECLPVSLFQQPEMKILDLSNNKLRTLPPQFWYSPKLSELNLSLNLLCELPSPISCTGSNNGSTDESGGRGSALRSRTVSPSPGRIPKSLSISSITDSMQRTDSVSSIQSLDSLDDFTKSSTIRARRVNLKPFEINLKKPWTGQVAVNLDAAGEGVFSSTSSFSRKDDKRDSDADGTLAKGYRTAGSGFSKTVAAKGRKVCVLTQLNLSHNGFERIPFLLSCIANRLTHLNMSYNRLKSIFDSEHFLGQYPVTLKHLDLSHNYIDEWIQPQSHLANQRKSGAQQLASSDSLDDVFSSANDLLESNRTCCHSDPKMCPFKKHLRLDQLKTLILSQNQLKSIVITKEELFDLIDRISSSLKPLKVGSLTLSNFTETVFRKGFTKKFAIFGSQDDLLGAASGNNLSGSISTVNEAGDSGEQPEMMLSAKAIRYSKLFFPNISMIDLSSNHISEIPKSIAYLSQLSVLNMSNNLELSSLPPEMGLLSKLWNLNTRGCLNLNEPIRSMIVSKTYKTADIISYLNSILENSKPYTRMKLMLVGVQGIGKTSLLEQLRAEGQARRTGRSADHWGKRMGSKSMGMKTPKGVTLSTVGVDLCEWVYERKPLRGREVRERSLSRTRMPAFHAAPSHFQGVVSNDRLGPVTFRTWDFGGQQEYYGTHQYFLSKRSIYLVVWKITDREKGVAGLHQWLVNIQSRAPGSPVIIVGTHYDLLKEYYPPYVSSDLQSLIRQKYMSDSVDADKRGLPKVVASVEVSTKSKHNIRLLANLIYETAWEMKLPGSKERLLEQKVPATYLALEEIVTGLAYDRIQAGKEPVLSGEQFKTEIIKGMKERGMHFRDLCELQQATKFLHENGVLLHYDDANLKDLFFLDPQWLADMLAHVVTIREINPFARCGIMRMDNLLALFKNSITAPVDVKQFMLSLLNKFELALTWDNRTMLVPSLLPTEEQLLNGFPGSEILVPIKTREKIRFTRSKLQTITENIIFENCIPFGELKSLLDKSSKQERIKNLFKINKDGFFESDGIGINQKCIEKQTNKVIEGECSGKPQDESIEIVNRETIFQDSTLKNSQKFEPCARVCAQNRGRSAIGRLLLLSYVPCGFWSRLITRIVADESIADIVKSYFILQNSRFTTETKLSPSRETQPSLSSSSSTINEDLEGLLNINNSDCQAHWHCWQTGFGLRFFGTFLLRVKEVALSNDDKELRSNPCLVPGIGAHKQTPNDYRRMKFFINSHADTVSVHSGDSGDTGTKWTELELSQQGTALIEILLPNQWLEIETSVPEVDSTEQDTDEGLETVLERRFVLEPNHEALTKLLVLIVEHIDTLLEDWYPALGTRFMHTSDGRFLVSRLVPCVSCLESFQTDSINSLQPLSPSTGKNSSAPQKPRPRIIKSPSTEGIDIHLTDFYKQEVKKAELEASELIDLRHESNDSAICVKSSDSFSQPIDVVETGRDADFLLTIFDNVYTFMIEECILAVYEDRKLECPVHGRLKMALLAPDALFNDLPARFCVDKDRLRFGKLLGRGSFGFVFRAFMGQKSLTGSDLAPNRLVANSKFYLPLREEQVVEGIDVALKLLQPIRLENLTSGLKKADMEAYNAMKSKWERDPLQYACKAYCTARTELQILASLKHPNIASILGLCPRPLALVLTLAPLGSLDCHVKQFRRSGMRIPVQNLQQSYLQVSKALEYLHQHHIIYRDLKSENVLVWSFPSVSEMAYASSGRKESISILLKLADYGISRSALPTGTKGFGGTEGFMAPEIMLYNGEEEYTEKVDCFSFAMFMYELATLRFPFEGQEFAIRENILDGIRPPLSQHDIDHLPESFVDLIVRCWAQQPGDRPSVSQIVSIISAPEFCSLRDVAILKPNCKVICAVAFAFNPCDADNEFDDFDENDDDVFVNQADDDFDQDDPEEEDGDDDDEDEESVENNKKMTLILSRIGQQIDIIESSNKRWNHIGHTLECDNIAGRTILSMAIVGGKQLWLGDSQSRIHVHSLYADFQLICMIDLPDRSGMHQQPSSTPSTLGIQSIISSGKFIVVWAVYLWVLPFRKLKELLQTSDKQCFTLDELGCVSLDFNGAPIFCVTCVPSSAGDRLCRTAEIWFGQAEGKLSVVLVHEPSPLSGVQIVSRTLLDHYEQKSIRKGLSTPLIGSDVPLQERANCALLASVRPATSGAKSFCASVLFNGSVIYQFDAVKKLIVHRLDCSKLVPCSESLCTFGFDDHFKPGNCQITALSVNGSEMYVGTNSGSIIVIESATLTPVIVFRPHNNEVKFIVSLESYGSSSKRPKSAKTKRDDLKQTPNSPQNSAKNAELSLPISPRKVKSKSPLKSFDFWKPFGLKSPTKSLPPKVPVQKAKFDTKNNDKRKPYQLEQQQPQNKTVKRKSASNEPSPQTNNPTTAQKANNNTNIPQPFVSIGRGQRNLLDRFIGNGSKMSETDDTLVAMLWHSSDWI